MTLRLTPDMLAAAYDFLRTTQPFRGWRLPEADDVGFFVTRDPHTAGYHKGTRRDLHDNEIGISERCVGSADLLMRYMGHEKIHLYQRLNRLETPGSEHNADFLQRARLVCRHHLFDFKAFV